MSKASVCAVIRMREVYAALKLLGAEMRKQATESRDSENVREAYERIADAIKDARIIIDTEMREGIIQ